MNIPSSERRDVYSLGFELLGDTEYLVEPDEQGRRIVYSEVGIPLDVVDDADARVEGELNRLGDILEGIELGLVHSRGIKGVEGFRVSPHTSRIAGALHTFASTASGLSQDSGPLPLEPFLLRIEPEPTPEAVRQFDESPHIKYARSLGMLVCRRSVILPKRGHLRSV